MGREIISLSEGFCMKSMILSFPESLFHKTRILYIYQRITKSLIGISGIKKDGPAMGSSFY